MKLWRQISPAERLAWAPASLIAPEKVSLGTFSRAASEKEKNNKMRIIKCKLQALHVDVGARTARVWVWSTLEWKLSFCCWYFRVKQFAYFPIPFLAFSRLCPLLTQIDISNNQTIVYKSIYFRNIYNTIFIFYILYFYILLLLLYI